MKKAYKNEKNMLTTFKLPNISNLLKGASIHRMKSSSITSTSQIQPTYAHLMGPQISFHGNVIRLCDEAWLKAIAKNRIYF